MIVVRAPLRISIGGGGTDLPSYYRRHGGMVISAAIDKYVYLAVNATFSPDYLLKYNELERVDHIDDIRHDLLREILHHYEVRPGVEIVSVADIPAGTGLGSSGTFTVGLVLALHAFRHQQLSPKELAEAACHIEIERLGDPVGKQDQYIASHGGLTRFDFHPDGEVDVETLAVSPRTLADLEDNLLLFFTGYSRRATDILADQKARSEQDDQAMLANLDQVLELGERIDGALRGGRTEEFGELMHEHWLRKRARTTGMSNDEINHWYDLARSHGAVGGKLVGAGAGGFLLFYTRDTDRLRCGLEGTGLTEVRFRFDYDGAVVLARS